MEEILDPDFTRFFAVVREDNDPSIKNLKRGGFVIKCPDAAIARLKRKLDGKLYLELPRSCRYEHARNVLAVAESPCRRRRNGDTIFLELCTQILHPDWRQILCAFSACSTPPNLSPELA